MDERLYRDLIDHARRAGWQLGVDPEDIVHQAYLRVLESGREPSPALLHRAVNSVVADLRRTTFRRAPALPLTEWAADERAVVEEQAVVELTAEEVLRELGDLAPAAVAIAVGVPLNEVARIQRRSKATWWRVTQRIREAYR